MIVAVPFYVLLAGCSPSVIRAGIMAMLGLAAARMHKLKDGLHLLSAAAIFMLAWDPYMLSNVGFQLSFLVTAGLILGVPPVRAGCQAVPGPKHCSISLRSRWSHRRYPFRLTDLLFQSISLVIVNGELRTSYRLLASLSCRWEEHH